MARKKSLLPYRNSVKKTKTFKIDKNVTYNQGIWFKPSGFWYEIEDCLFRWGELDWGKYIYEVELDTSKILIIKNYNDYIKFYDKYGKIRRFKNKKREFDFKAKIIDWEKVAKDYSGFEVINYNSIQKKLISDFNHPNMITWLETFDFSSGCIWNLKDLKVVKYVGEYELNSEEEKSVKSPKRTKSIKSPKRTKKTKSPKRTKKTKSPKRTKKNGF